MKNFRHNIDSALDDTFPVYNQVNTKYADTISQLNNIGDILGKKFKLGDNFADARTGIAMKRILSNTQSRASILKLLDGMQKTAHKYGIKIDEDVITQAMFADTLEKILGTEAPTSFLGQSSRAVSGFAEAGKEAVSGTPSGIIGGTLKAGKHLVDITRGITDENKLKAIKSLLGITINLGIKK